MNDPGGRRIVPGMTDRADADDRLERRRLVRGLDAAELVYGERTDAAVKRLVRLHRAGKLSAVRVSERGDRWFSTVELERLLASAESDP